MKCSLLPKKQNSTFGKDSCGNTHTWKYANKLTDLSSCLLFSLRNLINKYELHKLIQDIKEN